MALIREPFDCLGFEFDREDTLLRVLSYTNYHAGLLQIFAHELLNQMLNKVGATSK